MNDSRQIENLIYSYAERIDAGDLPGVAELFRDAEIVSTAHNSRRTGLDEVLEMYTLTCCIYESIQATESLPLQPIISGRYQDQFRKVEEEWQFASREMIVDLIGDCSAHLLYDASNLK